jgi:hypothetical protein
VRICDPLPTGTGESRAEDGAMEAGASSRYPLWTRGGVPTRMEGMQGGVWKGRARMEGRRGRRMAVGFADGDHGRGGGRGKGVTETGACVEGKNCAPCGRLHYCLKK